MAPSAAAEGIRTGRARFVTGRGVRGGRPLRVLHVVTRLGVGGTELVLSNVILGLEKEGFDPFVCSTRGLDPAFSRLRHLEGRLFSAGSASRGFQLLVLRLARIMRECRADIVHSRNWGAIEAVPAARLAGVPVAVHSEHGYEVENLSGFPFRQRLFRRAVYSLADALFTVTEELRGFHARQASVSPGRFRVIYNGVETGRFAPRPERRLAARRELGFPDSAFVAGTVGRMVPIKDQGTLLAAGEILAARGVDVRLLLVGSGPEREPLERRVASSEVLARRTTLAGSSDRVQDLLAAMDAFVLPSLREGMSNTLLEAMASALPVVATRVGGNPEVVEEGRTGWLFEPGDAHALADRLLVLAEEPETRRRLGARGRERVEGRFALQRMLRDYRDLYLELADRRGLLEDR